MKAFLKRRWILLSCVVVLLACSMVTLARITYKDVPPGLTAMTYYGVEDGYVGYDRQVSNALEMETSPRFGLHLPVFGAMPEFDLTGSGAQTALYFAIPLWLPLAAVIGWIVFRELRWREKRAKEADHC
jgi:hypothetical protein